MAIRFSVPSSCHHEVLEALHRLQLRVALHHHQQPREGARELVLGLLELLELLRIVEDLPRRLRGHLADAAPRLHHLVERRPLEVGGPLHGGDQVGDQVRPTLIDVLHLRPLRLTASREPTSPL